MPIPPIYEPELAAAGILRAAEGDERDVYVGRGGKMLALAERISPRLLDVQQLRSGFRKQRTEWPKSAQAPANLFDPVEHDGGLRGDFMAQSKDDSAYQAMAAHSSRSALVAAGALGLAAAVARARGLGGAAPLLGAGAAALAVKALFPRRGPRALVGGR